MTAKPRVSYSWSSQYIGIVPDDLSGKRIRRGDAVGLAACWEQARRLYVTSAHGGWAIYNLFIASKTKEWAINVCNRIVA